MTPAERIRHLVQSVSVAREVDHEDANSSALRHRCGSSSRLRRRLLTESEFIITSSPECHRVEYPFACRGSSPDLR